MIDVWDVNHVRMYMEEPTTSASPSSRFRRIDRFVGQLAGREGKRRICTRVEAYWEGGGSMMLGNLT